jgi:hypothetical protein
MEDAMHAARLAVLEGAVVALLREARQQDGGPDGLTVVALTEVDGFVSIDIEYTRDGVQIAGESL